MKKALSYLIALLSLIVCCTAYAANHGGLNNFVKQNAYSEGQFADVSTYDWFYTSVKGAYELGILTGTGEGSFSPKENVTVKQAIAIAARLRKEYYTKSSSFAKEDGEWYIPYADYLIDEGVISAGEVYDGTILRGEFVKLIATALDDNAFMPLRSVQYSDIPDLDGSEFCAQSALKLYRAGIISGSDEFATFAASTPITRAEVAAIVIRLANPAERKGGELLSLDSILVKNHWQNYGVTLGGNAVYEFYGDGSFTAFYLNGPVYGTFSIVDGKLYIDGDNIAYPKGLNGFEYDNEHKTFGYGISIPVQGTYNTKGALTLISKEDFFRRLEALGL